MIVGITGYKQSGKDTIGARLVEVHGFQRIAFADALKEILTVIGWNGSKDVLPPCHHCGVLQGRELLQRFGTEGIRDVIGADTWTELVRKKLTDNPGNWVVTDVRLENEAWMLRDLGASIWRVRRPGTEADGHSSETQVDAIPEPWEIFNVGTVGDLNFAVDLAMFPLTFERVNAEMRAGV